MGLFNLFRSNAPSRVSSSVKKSVSPKYNIDKILRDSDKAIEECLKADDAFKKDGNLLKRINVYERYFLTEPKWNCFNFCLRLAEMYIKADENDKAWGYLNKLYIWTLDSKGYVSGYEDKVRYTQFKLLKSEKRYKDALVMLVSSYVSTRGVSGSYFNKEKFIKDAKTAFKGIGLTNDNLNEFTNRLDNEIKQKRISENKVQAFCYNYFSEFNI